MDKRNSEDHAEVNMPIGDYKIVRKIGEGSTGTVYEVEDPRSHDHLAVKVFNCLGGSEEEMRRELFFFEAAVLQVIGRSEEAKRANIIKVYEVCRQPPYYYVMDLVAYRNGCVMSLRDIQRYSVDGELEFSEDQLASWFIDVAQSLVVLHRNGLVHGDITPSNIVLNKDNHAVLVDFGSVRAVEPSKALVRGIGDSTAVSPLFRLLAAGTSGFVAPEFYDQKRTSVTPLADSYSLGATIWYLLFNETMQISKYANELIHEEEYRCLFEDERWSVILPLMLEHDPRRRATVEEVLRKFLEGKTMNEAGKGARNDAFFQMRGETDFDADYSELLRRMDDYSIGLSKLQWESRGHKYEREDILNEMYSRYRIDELKLLKRIYEGRDGADSKLAELELKKQDAAFEDDFEQAGLSTLFDPIAFNLNALWAVAGRGDNPDEFSNMGKAFIERRVAVARTYLSAEAQFVFGKYRHIKWKLDEDQYFREGRPVLKYRGERAADRLFVYERTIARYVPCEDVIEMQLESLAQRNRIEGLAADVTLDLRKIWGLQ